MLKLNDKYTEVLNYKGYFVTKDGKVFSNRKGWKEIKGSPDKDGYLKITLVNNDGRFDYKRKHRIIAEAFLGKSKLQVNHKDKNKTNNRLENLEYVSSRENQCHRRNSNIGVCWSKKENKYRSYIQNNKMWYHLGFFDSELEAKKAYIKKAKELNLSLKYAI